MELIAGFLTPYILVGKEGAFVDGVKRILRWDEEEITIEGSEKVTFFGKNLKVGYKTADSVLIKGKISSVVFGGKR